MEHRSLGRSGLQVSVFTLGAMTFGGAEGSMQGVSSSDEEARRVFDRALDVGIDTIDTANIYSQGRSEELLGKWLTGKREQVVLATKCRFPTAGNAKEPAPHDHGLSRKAILRACEASLARLKTDYIDLYQVHMQDGRVPIEETMRALDELIRAGKVRYVGCSNYTGYRLVESLWASDRRGLAAFCSIQLQWSLVVRDAERELIPAARVLGLGTLVWSPLARGFLSGKYERGVAPPPGTRLATWQDSFKLVNQDAAWELLDRVRALAAARGTTPAAVSLAWLLQHPETSSIIVGARTKEQLDQNLEALALQLTAEELRMLDEASAPRWGYPYEFIGAREPW